MKPADLRAPTSPAWGHVGPYDAIVLDMEQWLHLDGLAAA